MNINCISNVNADMNCRKINNNTSFKAAYVTLSEKNLGNEIKNNVVDPYNDYLYNIVRSQSKKEFNRMADSTDFWVLGAGAGSRFVPVAAAAEKQTGVKSNKISLGIPMRDGRDIHMLDWAMAMATPFANGRIETKIAKDKSGSFGDIIKHCQQVRAAGGKMKDTIVCCGDNVFGTKKNELNDFMKEVIDNPNKQLGVVGVKKPTEEVAGRFGVLKTEPIKGRSDVASLTGFAEKPPYEEAVKYALPDGNCVANTGMFVIKAGAMEALMDALEVNPDLIKKDDVERYDFANAVKWTQATFGPSASDVKMVDTWEDVGEPKALYRFYQEVQNGQFLGEFGKYGKNIQKSLQQQYDAELGYLNISNRHKNIGDYTIREISKSDTVDGVTIL